MFLGTLTLGKLESIRGPKNMVLTHNMRQLECGLMCRLVASGASKAVNLLVLKTRNG